MHKIIGVTLVFPQQDPMTSSVLPSHSQQKRSEHAFDFDADVELARDCEDTLLDSGRLEIMDHFGNISNNMDNDEAGHYFFSYFW